MDSQKTILRSILTASPMALNIQDLNKEYRSTIGEPIPYIKLGYNSLEHLLRSIPDTVQVQGSGPFAIVNPVVSQKSAHVMNLVSRQKTEKKKHGNRFPQMKRMLVAPPQVSIQNIPNSTTRPQSQKIFYPNATKATSSSTFTMVSNTTNSNNTRAANSHHMPTNFPNKINQKHSITKYTNQQTNSVKQLAEKLHEVSLSSPASSPGVHNIQELNKSHMPSGSFRFALQNENQNLSNSGRLNNKFNQTTVRKPNSAAGPPAEDLEACVPAVVRKNLKTLIEQHPEGIWCADLPDVYRKMFKRELKYNDLGFRNLIDLCTCLKSIFHYIRPSTEDFKLYDRSKRLPDCAEKTFTASSFGNNNNSFSERDNNSALPNIDWSDIMSFLPAGVFEPGKEIPRTFVPESTKENDSLDIRIGEIYDVSKFWVYKDDGLLDTLMDSMQTFYNEYSIDYKLPNNLIREGVYCVTIIYGEYHRALIVDTMFQNDMTKVLFIDYGTMTKVKSELYFLHEQFATLPAQTIRCRLGNICPPEKGAPWSQQCTNEFRQLIKRRDLTAKINRINWKDQFLEISLADVTDSENVFYINSVLVERGFAVFVGQEQKNSFIDALSTPIVNLIHLFPTFLELEHGLAPSALEMEVYNKCNVPINFCYPQYFFVNTTDEENTIKQTTEFYEKNILSGSRKELYHQRILEPPADKQKMDLSHFGALEGEIRAFLKNQEESFDDYDEGIDEASNCAQIEESDISLISKKIEMWKTQTVEELKKDCLLSEDIMKDLLKICDINTQEESETKSEYTESETWMNEMYTFNEDNSEYDINEPNDLAEITSEIETYNTNNPFLKDLELDEAQPGIDIVNNDGRLLPTNPFLSYIQETKHNSDNNSSSSSSTDYGTYIQEVKSETSWSTNDNVGFTDIDENSVPCASLGQNSEPSVKPSTVDRASLTDMEETSESCASLGQNSEPAAKPGCDVTKPEFYPQNYFCPNYYAYPSFYPNTYVVPPIPPVRPVAFNNPYYSFAHHSYNAPVFLGPVVNDTQRARIPSGSLNPPPGFETVQPVGSTGAQPADFYDAYNRMLRARFGC